MTTVLLYYLNNYLSLAVKEQHWTCIYASSKWHELPASQIIRNSYEIKNDKVNPENMQNSATFLSIKSQQAWRSWRVTANSRFSTDHPEVNLVPKSAILHLLATCRKEGIFLTLLNFSDPINSFATKNVFNHFFTRLGRTFGVISLKLRMMFLYGPSLIFHISPISVHV